MKIEEFISKYNLPYRKVTLIKKNGEKVPIGDRNNMTLQEIRQNTGFWNSCFEGFINFIKSREDVKRRIIKKLKIESIDEIKKEDVIEVYSIYIQYTDFTIIDIDDVRLNEDVGIVPLEIRRKLKDNFYDLSTGKKLPHYWVKVTNKPKDFLEKYDQIKIFKDFDGDLLHEKKCIWVRRGANIRGKQFNTIDWSVLEPHCQKKDEVTVKPKQQNRGKGRPKKERGKFEENDDIVPENIEVSDSTDPLVFYLSCIPNNPTKSFDTWLKIGAILYNEGGKIEQWVDWTNQSPDYGSETVDDLKFQWESFGKRS